MTKKIARRAHAKLNLALSVAPPEPASAPRPGWHRIASLMVLLDLHDDVEVFEGDSSDWSTVWAGGAPVVSDLDWRAERDLAFRGANLVSAHAGGPSLSVRITKMTPVGGGLGGGSSDGVAAAIGAAAMLETAIDESLAEALTRELGADSAFFFDRWLGRKREPEPKLPRATLVSGFGERCNPLPLSFVPEIVLLLPSFGCPTPEVYGAFDREPSVLDADRVQRIASAADLEAMDEALFNDLLPAAQRVQPGLAHAISRAQEITGKRVHLTGSGSTMFVLSENAQATLDAIGDELGSIGLVGVSACLV